MKVKSSIADDKDSVNTQDTGTIESCPDEVDIPFSMIPNELIRSRELSPECGHLIINLLSNKIGWRISVAQLILRYKGFFGSRKVYKLIKEAIKAGYMKKEETRSKNKFGCVKYFVARTPKFKENFTLGSFEHAQNERAQKGHYKKNDKEERSSCVYQEDDNDRVDKSKAKIRISHSRPKPAAPIVRRSSYKVSPIALSPAAPIVPLDPSRFDPHSYKLPDGSLLSLRCANAFKKRMRDDPGTLLANVEYFEKNYHSGIDNPERYLQRCVTSNYAKEQTNKMNNILFTKVNLDEFALSQIKFFETVIKCGDQESINLGLDPDTFAELLKRSLRKANIQIRA